MFTASGTAMMNVSQPDARMVKALCGSLKMAFDSAKVNFLEAREAIQMFHRLLQKLEELEEAPNNEDDISRLKQLTGRLKESVSLLRMKLTKNSDNAEEGIKLLQEHLKKVDNILGILCNEKGKFEEGFRCYKRLRTGLNSHVVALKKEEFSDRKRKLASLEKAIVSTELSISNVKMEKEALTETCCKMEDFLDGTKNFINQLRNRKVECNEQGDILSNWCSEVVAKLPHAFDLRSHTVDSNTLAFEFLNPHDSPHNAPRLILTVTFMSRERYGNPYSIMHAKVNHDSLNVETIMDFAIQKNDLVYLLINVQAAWKKHFFLLLEVISLRERYPIDWQPDEGKLCVLLGDRVNINCMMNIPRGYPLKGKISIERIEGADTDVDLQINEGDMSLTAWVEHLATRFHRM